MQNFGKVEEANSTPKDHKFFFTFVPHKTIYKLSNLKIIKFENLKMKSLIFRKIGKLITEVIFKTSLNYLIN